MKLFLRFLPIFLLSEALLTFMVVGIFLQESRLELQVLGERGRFVIELEREFLNREFHSVREDLQYLAQQSDLLSFASGQPAFRAEVQDDYLKFATAKPIYDQIRFIGRDGQELVRINREEGRAKVVPDDQLQTKADRYYYVEAMALGPNEVFVTPFDLNVEHGQIERPLKPVIRFLTPVVDRDGSKLGLVVLNYLGANLLEELRNIAAPFPGDVLLINDEGEYLKSTDPRHDWGWMIGHEFSFRREFPVAWPWIQSASFGQRREPNGLFTFVRIPLQGDRQDSPPPSDQANSSIILISHVPASMMLVQSYRLLAKLMVLLTGSSLLVALISYYWARSSQIRRQQQRALVESELRLRQLTTQLLEAQEHERKSISRDLHDQLGQLVTAVIIDLQSLISMATDERMRTTVRRVCDQAEQMLADLHRIASQLRPTLLDDLGLHDALESMIQGFEQRGQMRVSFDDQLPPVPELPDKIKDNIYRIIQESLSNIEKHAHTTQVWISLKLEAGRIRVEVVDRGAGFDIHQPTSRLGILGMRERVELINGEFEITSEPGKGTQIRASIPWRSSATKPVAAD